MDGEGGHGGGGREGESGEREGGLEMSYIDDDGGGEGVVDEILSNDDVRYAKDE